jgi:HAD superfamily hydrolase (TIGR01459 family)
VRRQPHRNDPVGRSEGFRLRPETHEFAHQEPNGTHWDERPSIIQVRLQHDIHGCRSTSPVCRPAAVPTRPHVSLPASDRREPQALASLDAVSGRYDALLCDLWGVVHDGVHVFGGAVAALQRFRAGGGRVVLLSNVPKPHTSIPSQLTRLGVPEDCWDSIVTSGDATRAVLAERAPGPVYLLGTDGDAAIWAGLPLEFTGLDDATFVLTTGLTDFFHGRPEDHADELHRARARDLELVCANPDVVVRHGGALYHCAGALARDYEALGGRVLMPGKPNAPIYALALAEVQRLAGDVERARVLVIGDGPTTDVRGANREGLDALFVAGGIHSDDLTGARGFDLTAVAETLTRAGVSARFVMPTLA